MSDPTISSDDWTESPNDARGTVLNEALRFESVTCADSLVNECDMSQLKDRVVSLVSAAAGGTLIIPKEGYQELKALGLPKHLWSSNLDKVDLSTITIAATKAPPASDTINHLWDEADKRVASDWSKLQATQGLMTYFKRDETLTARDAQLRVAQAIIEGIVARKEETIQFTRVSAVCAFLRLQLLNRLPKSRSLPHPRMDENSG